MKKFAMVLLAKVIGIESSNEVPIWGPDAEGNAVIPIECNDDNVQLGWLYDSETKTFSEPPVIEPVEPPLTELEQSIIEAAINTDYLVCLSDLDI